MSVPARIHRCISLRVAGRAHGVSSDNHVSGAVHCNRRCNVLAVVGAIVALLPEQVAIADSVLGGVTVLVSIRVQRAASDGGVPRAIHCDSEAAIISMPWSIVALNPDLVCERGLCKQASADAKPKVELLGV